MSTFEVRKRDGLARIGLYKDGDLIIQTPTVIDPITQFPNLSKYCHTNIPFSTDQSDICKYYIPGDGPIMFNPSIKCPAKSGDVIVVSGWKSTLNDSKRYIEYLSALHTNTPPDTARYAPASALPSNVSILIATGFDIFDYTAVDLASIQGWFCRPEGKFDSSFLDKGVCVCEGCKTHNLQLHNRITLLNEISFVKTQIEMGQTRELIEQRCRLNPEHVSLIRRLDKTELEYNAIPVVRSSKFYSNSSESLTRPEISFFETRLIDRFVPSRTDICVLLPCSARKPYSQSKTHQKFQTAIDNRAHEVIITSPLGVVPRELEHIYPASHYDVPVTGYWDREELEIISNYISEYLSKHKYDRILCHLSGGAKEAACIAASKIGIDLEFTCTDDRPTSPTSLK
ncbi:MAG TPA: DUF5591 domain-containing protein, partial [Methanocorpusculum sp.]|nr:DUF5591 domain-containing protein [Methanocorpusculum sp.]